MKINVFLGHLLIAGLVTSLTAYLVGGLPLRFFSPAGCDLPSITGGLSERCHPSLLDRTNLFADLIFWWVVSTVISMLVRNLTHSKEES